MLFCALWDVWQHGWPAPTRRQQHHSVLTIKHASGSANYVLPLLPKPPPSVSPQQPDSQLPSPAPPPLPPIKLQSLGSAPRIQTAPWGCTASESCMELREAALALPCLNDRRRGEGPWNQQREQERPKVQNLSPRGPHQLLDQASPLHSPRSIHKHSGLPPLASLPHPIKGPGCPGFWGLYILGPTVSLEMTNSAQQAASSLTCIISA